MEHPSQPYRAGTLQPAVGRTSEDTSEHRIDSAFEESTLSSVAKAKVLKAKLAISKKPKIIGFIDVTP